MENPSPPVQPSLITKHVRAMRFRIGFTYMLTLAEIVFELLYPWAIGLAINGLIGSDPWALSWLAGVWAAHIVVGGARQAYDTRLFSKLSAAIATELSFTQRASGEMVSAVSARAVMVEEVRDFLEFEVPYLLTLVLGLFGGMAMIYLYDIPSGLIMTALLIPVTAIFVRLGKVSLRLHRVYNDQSERQVTAIERAKRSSLRTHFLRLANLRIRLSDREVVSWTGTEALALVATCLILLQLAAQPEISAGELFAALTYVLIVVDNIDEVPEGVQKLAQLIDIRDRLRSD